eukprot:363864-Chlamydomonas_euryale.AAC.24
MAQQAACSRLLLSYFSTGFSIRGGVLHELLDIADSTSPSLLVRLLQYWPASSKFCQVLRTSLS